MLGAIIGDIVGSRWEFSPTNDYDFELFSDRNSFTDDTICTIAVADALLHDKDFGASLHEWCRRYPAPMGGYGGRFRMWVMSDRPQPYGSFGNGSAMRVSAVGWYYNTLEEVRREAAKTAQCTHNHPEGVKGAVAVAEAIFKFRRIRRDHVPEAKEIKSVCAEVAKAHAYDIESIRLEAVRNKFEGSCQGTVPVAIWIITRSHGFEDAVRKAVALGADADTLADIVGAIAEAIWGIPEWIKRRALTYLPEEIKSVLRDFRGAVWQRTKEAMEKEKLEKEKKRAEEDEEMKQYLVLMFWKLAYGNPNDPLLHHRWTAPDQGKPATKDSWKCEPMPQGEEVSTLNVKIFVDFPSMDILRKGHIPASQEDHWFMYCDDEYIRYYRSWTGMCAFEARYVRIPDGYAIMSLKINRNLCEFGVNGDEPGKALFIHLISAQTGHDGLETWNNFEAAWKKQYYKNLKNEKS